MLNGAYTFLLYRGDKFIYSLCCISPVLAARVIPGCEVTIGTDAGTAGAINEMGAKHVNRYVNVSFHIILSSFGISEVGSLNTCCLLFAALRSVELGLRSPTALFVLLLECCQNEVVVLLNAGFILDVFSFCKDSCEPVQLSFVASLR
jgi:hypothetical protein